MSLTIPNLVKRSEKLILVLSVCNGLNLTNDCGYPAYLTEERLMRRAKHKYIDKRRCDIKHRIIFSGYIMI